MKLTEKQKLWLRGQADIIVECLPDDLPIRGNALASGNDTEDKACEDAIIDDLESGNEWAWCCVKVTYKWDDFEGNNYLGGCSYKSMRDFKESDYFVDMVDSAFDDLVLVVEKDMESFLKLMEQE